MRRLRRDLRQAAWAAECTKELNLDFIMKNQSQFTRPVDACRDALVLVYPPTEDDRAEAATWMSGNYGAGD